MKKYIRIKRPDGIGSQLAMFANGAARTNKYDFIVDPRSWQYFGETEKIDFSRISNLFSFHKRALVNPAEIDMINEHDIIDVPNGGAGAYCDWKALSLNYPIRLYQGTQKFNKNKFFRLTDYPLMKLKKEPVVDFNIKKCVGVHVRIGNGELEHIRRTYNSKKQVKRFLSLPRIAQRIRTEMRKFKNVNFFVCSDTKAFIDACRDEFGDRIKTVDRFHLPEGAGPGHLPLLYQNLKDIDADAIDFLHEAYVDMHLLSKCSHLICGASQFNLLARNSVPPQNIKRFWKGNVDTT